MILVLISSPLFSQGDGAQYNTNNTENFINIPEKISSNIDVFFKTLMTGEVKKAYKNLLAGSPILEKEDDLINLVDQTKRSIAIYGDIKDYEPVSIDKATNSFIRLRYLGLHNKFPMRWIFTYYNSPSKGWILTNIKFDDLSEFFFQDN